MGLVLFGLFIFLAFMMASFVWSSHKKSAIASDTNRCINNNCLMDENWSADGRVYTEGFAVTKNNTSSTFIKQSKLCDIGILD